MDEKGDSSRFKRKHSKVEKIRETDTNQTGVSRANEVEVIDLDKERKFRIRIQPKRSKRCDEPTSSNSSMSNLEANNPNSKAFGLRDRSISSSSSVGENRHPQNFRSPLDKIGMCLIDDDSDDNGNDDKDVEEPEADAADRNEDNSAPQPYYGNSSGIGIGTSKNTTAAAADDDDDECEAAITTYYRCSDCKTEFASVIEVQYHRLTCRKALKAMADLDS